MVTLVILPITLLAIWLPSMNTEYVPPGPRYRCPKETERLLLHPCVCENGTDSGLYVRCENAGLAVLSVGLGNIAGLELPIERLVLKECDISHLFGSLLHRSIVRILRIEDVPIQTIDQYAFAGINRTLQELYMVNTRIENFPKEAFKILGNLAILHINGHRMSKLDKDIFAGSEVAGRLERLHIVNGLLADLPVEAFQTLRKLKTLDLHGNRLVSLKRNQFKGLRDTEVLDLSYNNITKLEGVHIADLTKMGWCNVSHNSIGDIPRGMFARNTILKVVHLNSNRIKKLDTNSFRGMRMLRRLYLQDNEISDVGRGTFDSVTRIGTIDLARNRITKVDFQMFQQVKYAELINLAENVIESIDQQAFTDMFAATVNISHNRLTEIAPDAFQRCNNMTVLDLSHNNLTGISVKAFDEHSYAFEMRLSYNRFSDFGQIPIHNMAGLAVLNVSHNEITVMPRTSFPKLYELHTVDVSHNMLSDIHGGIFQNLFSLRYLNLSHNHMEVIKSSTFGTIHTVLDVNLSHNRLRDVARGGLAKLSSCRTLDISHNSLDKIFQISISLGELNFAHNNLSEIRASTWPAMNALLRLYLSSNQLGDSLEADSFSGLLTLQSLDVSANGLTRAPWEALSRLTSLRYLNLQGNNLTSLTKSAFGILPTLFDLDLSGNQLSDVAALTFQGLQQVTTLNLSRNALERIPNEAFKGLVAMRTLDLSQNLLERIDNKTHGLLDDCLSLDTLNLSHNSIGSFTKKMFPSNPYIPYRIQNVDMSHNQLSVITFDLTYGTKTLLRLDLSNNHISDIRDHVLGNLTNLDHLDLSANKLKDMVSRLTAGNFSFPPKISYLNVSNNALVVLPIGKIFKAESLRVLDVRNNRLVQFDPILVKRVEQGLVVHFEGNNLRCDCLVRPLKHYIGKQLRASMSHDLICKEPPALLDARLVDLDEDRLTCAGNDVELYNQTQLFKEYNGEELTFDFVTEPDLSFRDIQYSQPAIYVHWYVLSKRDVADFLIYIRDKRNRVFFTQDVPYSQRSLSIPLDGATVAAIQDGVEICAQARNSMGVSRKFYQHQCRDVPTGFQAWPKKLSLDKRRLRKKTRYYYGNSVYNLVSDSILITLCIFLGACLRKLSDLDMH